MSIEPNDAYAQLEIWNRSKIFYERELERVEARLSERGWDEIDARRQIEILTRLNAVGRDTVKQLEWILENE